MSFAYVTIRYIFSIAIFLLGWEMIVTMANVPNYLISRPSAIFTTLSDERHLFIDATRYTVTNTAFGAAIGVAGGVLSALVLAYSRTARALLEPYLFMFQSFPREALFPLLIVWLGFGASPKIANAALLSYFPMAVICLSALLNVREDYLLLVRTWGASRWQEFLHCRIPFAIPAALGALRIALPLAIIGAVLGEFLGSNKGLGYLIITSGAQYRLDRLFGALVILAGVGLTTVTLVQVAHAIWLRRFSQE